MNKFIVCCIGILISVFISAISQILLKKSALKKYPDKIKEYMNLYVISAYLLFFLCTLLTVFCYKYVPLSVGTILQTAGYIFIPVLSYFFIKENIKLKQIIGIFIIIIGIVVFSYGSI